MAQEKYEITRRELATIRTATVALGVGSIALYAEPVKWLWSRTPWVLMIMFFTVAVQHHTELQYCRRNGLSGMQTDNLEHLSMYGPLLQLLSSMAAGAYMWYMLEEVETPLSSLNVALPLTVGLSTFAFALYAIRMLRSDRMLSPLVAFIALEMSLGAGLMTSFALSTDSIAACSIGIAILFLVDGAQRWLQVKHCGEVATVDLFLSFGVAAYFMPSNLYIYMMSLQGACMMISVFSISWYAYSVLNRRAGVLHFLTPLADTPPLSNMARTRQWTTPVAAGLLVCWQYSDGLWRAFYLWLALIIAAWTVMVHIEMYRQNRNSAS